jgi:hypothetical protein
MRCTSVRALLAVLVVAVVSGCGSGSTGKPSAASSAANPARSGSISSQSIGLGSQRPPLGKIAGQLLFVGGPAPGLPRPRPAVHGTVTFTVTGTARDLSTVPVDIHGAFSVHLSPGTYSITATSPDYDGGHGVCLAKRPVRVSDRSSTAIKVYCQVR